MEVVGAALIVAGLAIGVSALTALHVLPTGLSPVRNAVSQYGISRYRAGYRVQTLGYAVAGVGAAAGLATLSGPVGAVVALCAVFATARAMISWVPMDAPGTPRTTTGSRHGLLAIVAFVSVGLAGWRLTSLLNQDGTHAGIASASGVLAALMAISLIGTGLARRSGVNAFGLVERCFYVCMTAWLVVVAILLLLPN